MERRLSRNRPPRSWVWGLVCGVDRVVFQVRRGWPWGVTWDRVGDHCTAPVQRQGANPDGHGGGPQIEVVTLTPTGTPTVLRGSKATGRTYWVQASGGGAAIQAAIDAAGPGDVIVLEPGKYVLERMLRITHDGPVTLEGSGAELVTRDEYGILLNACYWTLRGLDVSGARSHGIMITGASDNLIEVCAFHGNGWAGVMFGGDEGPAHRNVVRGCQVYENRMEGIYLRGACQQQAGQYIPMSGNVIEGCDVWGNGAEGIQNSPTNAPQQPGPDGTVIRQNRVYDNGGDWGGGMSLEGHGLVIEGNTVERNGGAGPHGVYVGPNSSGLVINNVVVAVEGPWGQTGIVSEAAQVTVVGNRITVLAASR